MDCRRCGSQHVERVPHECFVETEKGEPFWDAEKIAREEEERRIELYESKSREIDENLRMLNKCRGDIVFWNAQATMAANMELLWMGKVAELRSAGLRLGDNALWKTWRELRKWERRSLEARTRLVDLRFNLNYIDEI